VCNKYILFHESNNILLLLLLGTLLCVRQFKYLFHFLCTTILNGEYCYMNPKSRKLNLRKVSLFKVSHQVDGRPEWWVEVSLISNSAVFSPSNSTSIQSYYILLSVSLAGNMGSREGWICHDIRNQRASFVQMVRMIGSWGKYQAH
jgi:hypothetical protein